MSEEAGFTAADLRELGGYVEAARPSWHMVRAELGVRAFGVNAWQSTEPGQAVIVEHDELSGGAGGHEELYVVVSGRATFTVEGETVPAPAGTVVFVRDPALTRSAVAETADTLVLVVGGRPGEAFSVSPWEASSEALRYWTTGDWDRAAEVLARRLEAEPENATVAYNLACAESRGGRLDAAVEHLARAVELQPSFAESAQTDADLEAIREHPGFLRA
jgi:tetratricopeptide (TPR) repeat protein